jgi:hypothetical protein
MPLLHFAAHMAKMFLRHHEAEALWRAATAGMLFVVLQVVAIVEREFFAGPKVAQRVNPDALVFHSRFAVRRATVIDESGRVPIDRAVEVERVRDGEDEKIVCLPAAQGFLFADAFAEILDNSRFRGHTHARENSHAVNAGGFDFVKFG